MIEVFIKNYEGNALSLLFSHPFFEEGYYDMEEGEGEGSMSDDDDSDASLQLQGKNEEDSEDNDEAMEDPAASDVEEPEKGRLVRAYNPDENEIDEEEADEAEEDIEAEEQEEMEDLQFPLERSIERGAFILGEILSCLKESNKAARDKAYELLSLLADKCYSIHSSSRPLIEYFCASLASNSAFMISASIVAINHLIHHFHGSPHSHFHSLVFICQFSNKNKQTK